ncbi:MAG: alpha/beta hydrolase [Halorhodospira halophila]|uniref:alpha/beta fold hydrolase n=1 Tax=Halorhodospira TaxID=85108 RepID=UPI0019116865|nr:MULTISPECIES: alpha/beta hydrolase [Halorhodospira]MCG5542619.1 alpha/beta hydrolase [Halorhodospira sp. 9628]MBK5935312.1 hypothetical protein [Halorhodospira halophila]MBK5943514.1 hypothetical protein [Halorhodospira halophila]MCC3750182.1 alpha/beta hydrolase [Halorhodospira halophila]MCG5538037.1 alpha/beta hydrolase [Halorhodospira sp. 9622]
MSVGTVGTILQGIGIVVGGLFILAGLVLAIGPFMIPTQPADGVKDGRELGGDDSRFVSISFPGYPDGLQLHYVAAGEEHADTGRPAWLLLHGFSFSTVTWEPLLPKLGRDRYTVAYDQIPYGLSDKPDYPGEGPNPFTLEADVDHLFSLMDELGQEEAVLVGNSAGGVIALEAARQAPERVAGLVLINPMAALERPTLPQWLAQLPQAKRLSLLGGRWFGKSTELLERSYYDEDAITPEREARMTMHTAMAGWDRAWGQLMHRSLTDALQVRGPLAGIETPTQVIISVEDEVIPAADSHRVADALPNAERVELQACGHLPQEECPAKVAEAIERWRERQGL